MRDDEKAAFAKLLNGVAAYYDRRLTADTVAIYWNGLADLSIDAVRSALNAHVQDSKSGQFMPKIADIRRAIEATRDDGHPGPDEAWSIALPARHESSSVVWTAEIRTAFFEAAMPLLDEGDKIAARKAFIERYEREVSVARFDGQCAVWTASLGADPKMRAEALETAQRAGRIRPDYAQKLLPMERVTVDDVRRIESALANSPAGKEESARRLAALRKMLGMA